MFTNNKNNDIIEIENFNSLSEENKKSIDSAHKAMNSGIIPKSVYIASIEKNGGIVKSSENNFKTEKFEKDSITEELEKKRIAKAANVKSFEAVSEDAARYLTSAWLLEHSLEKKSVRCNKRRRFTSSTINKNRYRF